jgi:AbrB family looped-hinge helix DNA binding protein
MTFHTCVTYLYMKCKKANLSILWVVTVGTKWQIVIPKEIRDTLGIVPGKKFITLLKDGKYLGLVDHEDMEDLKKYIDTV